MSETMIRISGVLLPVLYLALWGGYLWAFFDEREHDGRWRARAIIALLIVHGAAETLIGVEYGRLPLASPSELASSIAFSLTVVYFVVERVLRVMQTGVLVIGLAFFLQLLASVFAVSYPVDDPLLNDPGFGLHAALIVLSYTALSLAFIYAVLYAALERQLASRRFGLLFRRLPPLETLERLSVNSVRLGVLLLFLALVTGHLWMFRLTTTLPAELTAQLSHVDPKIVASWIILMVYGVGLVGHERWGWRGRRMGRVAVLGWILLFIVLGVVHLSLPTFHDFTAQGGV